MKNVISVLVSFMIVGITAANAQALEISRTDAGELIQALDHLVETKEISAAPKVKISTMAALGFTVSSIKFSDEVTCSILVSMQNGTESERFFFTMVKPGSNQSTQGRFGWSTKKFDDFTAEYQKVSKACIRLNSLK